MSALYKGVPVPDHIELSLVETMGHVGRALCRDDRREAYRLLTNYFRDPAFAVVALEALIP